jgi:hypothetical protein
VVLGNFKFCTDLDILLFNIFILFATYIEHICENSHMIHTSVAEPWYFAQVAVPGATNFPTDPVPTPTLTYTF